MDVDGSRRGLADTVDSVAAIEVRLAELDRRIDELFARLGTSSLVPARAPGREPPGAGQPASGRSEPSS
jgi:hypothetical protein